MRRTLTLLVALILMPALAGCVAAPTTVPSGELAVALDTQPDPPVAGGEAALTFTVTQGGQPVTGARVLVVRRMIGVVHPEDDIIFESAEQGAGRYGAATSFAEAGRWDVQVIVTPPSGEATTASFTLDVARP